MKKLLCAITIVIAAASVAVCVVIQRRTASALQERADSAAAQARNIADLDVENKRLSQIVDKLKKTQGFSQDEMMELAKLRHDVSKARHLAAAKPGLEAANAKLRKNEADRRQHLAEAQALANYWPKDQLAFAGFATPDDTVKTVLWNMLSCNSNVDDWQSYCTPQAIASMQEELLKRGLTPEQVQAQWKAIAGGLTSASDGFHIVDEQFPSPDRADIALSFDGEDAVRTFILKKIDDQWKFDDLLVAGQTKPARAP